MALNENSTNVAYTLGRTFAVLEAIQEEANPGINATIKDRYFNSACATPASIFPVLFKLENSHIKKISSPGTKIHYEKMLGNFRKKFMSVMSKGMLIPDVYLWKNRECLSSDTTTRHENAMKRKRRRIKIWQKRLKQV